MLLLATWPSRPGLAGQDTGPNPAKDPVGIFYLLDAQDVISETLPCWTNLHVLGVTVRKTWAELNPAPGVYNFDEIRLAASLGRRYNKQIGVYVGALIDFPSFVQPITVNVGDAQHPVAMAVPWDVNFLVPFTTLIAELGSAFDGQIDYTVMGGLGQTGESILTTNPRVQAQLDLLGGLPAWQGSCTTITQTYAAAFPTTPFVFSAANPYGASNAEGGTTLDTLVQGLAQTYPGMFGIKNSVLSSKTTPKGVSNRLIYLYSATNPVGQQCVTNSLGTGKVILGGLANALAAGEALGDHWIEVYAIDCDNPDYSDVLDAANDYLSMTY